MKKTHLLLALLLLATTQLQAQYNIKLLGKRVYSGQSMSSIWGYTDETNGKKYAIVGTSKGTSIVDISNPAIPVQVAFANGSNGSWREVKVYNKHAYISQDNNIDTLTSEGVLIIDLSNLPASVKVDSFRRDNLNNRIAKTHSLSIDEKGFLYLNGGRSYINRTGQNGCIIYDLKNNPKKPQFAGYTPSPAGTTDNYVHDSYTRNDTLFESNVYAGKLSIYDVRNKSNPNLIVKFSTPFAFTHNSWLSDDSKTLFTTDEKASAPIGVYDIHDITSPVEIGQIKSSPNETSIPHNVHVWHDYLVVPHYTLGVVIWDALDPTNIVKIGYYDTNNFNGSGFNGVWDAYPYFADSTLILSDIEGGLFILKPTYIRAARIQGTVTDTNTTQALTGVKISFADTAISVLSTIDGTYKTGTPKAGRFLFKAEKTGYQTKYFYATLTNGSITVVDIQLRQIPVEVSASDIFCEGRPYALPDGRTVTTAGIYISDIVLPSGKDSIITTTLSTLPKSVLTLKVSICEGDSYLLPDGTTTATSGTFSDSLTNSLGCDSIVTYTITAHPEYTVTKNDSIYEGDAYLLPDGSSTSTAGIYPFTLRSVFGCDSLVTIDLKVLDTVSITGIRNNISSLPIQFSISQQQLTVINPSGIRIRELAFYNSIGSFVLGLKQPSGTLTLPAMPKGIYILRAITDQNEQHIAKVAIY